MKSEEIEDIIKLLYNFLKKKINEWTIIDNL